MGRRAAPWLGLQPALSWKPCAWRECDTGTASDHAASPHPLSPLALSPRAVGFKQAAACCVALTLGGPGVCELRDRRDGCTWSWEVDRDEAGSWDCMRPGCSGRYSKGPRSRKLWTQQPDPEGDMPRGQCQHHKAGTMHCDGSSRAQDSWAATGC